MKIPRKFLSLLGLAFAQILPADAQQVIPVIPSVGLPQVALPSIYQLNSVKGGANTVAPLSPLRGSISNSQILQNQQILREIEQFNAQREIPPSWLQEVQQEKMYLDCMERLRLTASYRAAWDLLSSMNPDKFSLSKVVFTVENAWFDNKLSYEQYKDNLQIQASIVRQLLKRESLNPKSNTALNYGIQKLYQQANTYYSAKRKQSVTIKPFRYDFVDIKGEKDYLKLLTVKMLKTGKGQCHSMPLMYLMIAETLGAEAWLSLAPEHSFIQFKDNDGNLQYFETTNGNLVSPNWMLQSGFINANALKSKSYLDTLSQRQLFAQCLADLLLSYKTKFGYDDFTETIRQRILQLSPGNMTAHLMDASLKTQFFMQSVQAAGVPKPEDLPQYPAAYQQYLAMQESYAVIDNLGYQQMPDDAYQNWLKSMETEKKKQENIELQERLKADIKRMKQVRSTVTDKTKD